LGGEKKGRQKGSSRAASSISPGGAKDDESGAPITLRGHGQNKQEGEILRVTRSGDRGKDRGREIAARKSESVEGSWGVEEREA